MKVISTTQISSIIEEILDSANQILVIVSPYLKITKRLKVRLSHAFNQVDQTYIIYRENKLLRDEKEWLNSQTNVNLFPIENLHAKIYLNEEQAIITSMNLYEYSQINNHEIGVLLDINSDTVAFEDSLKQIEFILASENHNFTFPTLFRPEEELTMSNLIEELNEKYTFRNYRPKSQRLYEYLSELSCSIVDIQRHEMYQDRSAILRGTKLGRSRYATLKKQLVKYSHEHVN